MSVTQVKSAMYELNAEISNTLNSVNNLINILSGVTDSTSNLIASPSSRLKANLSVLERDVKFLHNMTGVELHILFREYNTLLSKTIVEIGRVENTLDILISDSKLVYMIQMLIIFMKGFLKRTHRGNDLKNHIPQLVRFRAILIKLQSATTINNNKLIIKNNRGWVS